MTTVIPKKLVRTGPVCLSQMTPREEELICNGVGPKGLGFKCWQSFFSAPAFVHDVAYWRGGTSEDRKNADKLFLEQCLYVVSMVKTLSPRPSKWRQFHYSFAAGLMYRLTRIFGFLCWHYGTPRTWDDLEKLVAEADSHVDTK